MKYIINEQVIYDSVTRELSISNGSKVILPIATARLLELFFAHHRRPLNREVIIEEVWNKQGMVPSGHSLSKNISILRKALSSLGLDKAIETIHREGFIFQANVRSVTTSVLPQEQTTLTSAHPKSPPPKYKQVIVWFSFGLTILVSGWKLLPEIFKNSNNIVYVKASGVCEIYTKNSNSIDKTNNFLRSSMWESVSSVCDGKNRVIIVYDDNGLSETNKLRECFFSVCVINRQGITNECENYIY